MISKSKFFFPFQKSYG